MAPPAGGASCSSAHVLTHKGSILVSVKEVAAHDRSGGPACCKALPFALAQVLPLVLLSIIDACASYIVVLNSCFVMLKVVEHKSAQQAIVRMDRSYWLGSAY